MAETSLSHQRPAVLGGVMLGIFLAAMEATVVSTAMPTVIASLGGLRIYSWVFSAYLLTSTVSMPLWGKLSDLFGRRPTYLFGIALFLTGSALSGLSVSMPQLIVFRAIQGLGSGALIPLGMTIIGDLYGLEQRAKVQGYFSVVWGTASLVGPFIGGLLTDYFSWRWVFYLNLPVGLLAGGLIAFGLRPVRSQPSTAKVDTLGALTFASGVSLLLLALIEGGRRGQWQDPMTLAMVIGSLLLFRLFVAVERKAAEPIVSPLLFRNPIFRAAAVNGLLVGMAMFGTISFIPLFVQAVIGTSATEAGSTLTPFVLGWVSLSVISSRLLLRIGYRIIVMIGMGGLVLAFAFLSQTDLTTTRLAIMWIMLLGGCGMGCVMVPMLIAVQSSVPKRDLGAATSATTFFRSIGGAVGVALMGGVMAHRLHSALEAWLSSTQGLVLSDPLLATVRNPDAIIDPLTRSALPPTLLEPLRLAMAQALHGVFVVGLLVSLLAFASAFLIPRGGARELAGDSNVKRS
jgi:EmrB/QacA subfamily drug resistance transporter